MNIHLNKNLNKMNKTPHYEEISHNILIRQLLLEDQRLLSLCLELHTTVLKISRRDLNDNGSLTVWLNGDLQYEYDMSQNS